MKRLAFSILAAAMLAAAAWSLMDSVADAGFTARQELGDRALQQ